ncbi:hypothetical protein BaRGS_00014252, partial [Batillaria attramentaria]
WEFPITDGLFFSRELFIQAGMRCTDVGSKAWLRRRTHAHEPSMRDIEKSKCTSQVSKLFSSYREAARQPAGLHMLARFSTHKDAHLVQ